MRIMLEPGAFMPERAHCKDAGLDIRALHDGIVRAGQSAIFHTGVRVELPPYTMGDMRSKSGLMFKHEITSDGTIDEGYMGEIMVKLFNHGSQDYRVQRGDKISQLVVIPIFRVECDVVDDFGYTTERGNRGFGSTGL